MDSVAGFVEMLIGDLWTLLDGGEGDYRLIAPRTHPLDPMDRASHKVCTSSYFLSLCVSSWASDAQPSRKAEFVSK